MPPIDVQISGKIWSSLGCYNSEHASCCLVFFHFGNLHVMFFFILIWDGIALHIQIQSNQSQNSFAMFSNVTKILAGQILHSLQEHFFYFLFLVFSFLLTLVSLVCVYICVFKFVCLCVQRGNRKHPPHFCYRIFFCFFVNLVIICFFYLFSFYLQLT